MESNRVSELFERVSFFHGETGGCVVVFAEIVVEYSIDVFADFVVVGSDAVY